MDRLGDVVEALRTAPNHQPIAFLLSAVIGQKETGAASRPRTSVVSHAQLYKLGGPLQRWHFQRRSAAIDFVDDVVGGFCPNERLRVGVVVVNVVVDRSFEFLHGLESAASNELRCDQSEPALDKIQPR